MADLNLPLTGVAGEGAVGTAASSADGGDRDIALTGASGIGALGATIPDYGSATSLALVGNAGAAALGSLSYGEGYALSGVDSRAAVGFVSADVVVGQMLSMTMPVWSLALTGINGIIGEVDIDWPMPTLQITGLVGSAGALGLSAPMPTLQITGLVGSAGALDLPFPSPTFAFGSGNVLGLEFTPPTLVMTGLTGVIGSVGLRLPAPTLQLTGTAHAAGPVVLNFPMLRMAVTGDTGRVARLALTMKALQLAINGTAGVIGTLELELPIFQLDVVGAQPAAGSLALLLPAFQLLLDGGETLVAGQSEASATTLVMQTERGALTRYTNYPFNSFAAFNGVFLGACDDGVFALTGADDAGTAIAAAARVGITDFGTSHLKRIERIYVGYRSTGRMVLRVITEERWTRDYALAPATHAGLHGAHVRLGRGLEARYWQFELQNDAGGDFDQDMMEMKPIKLKRRVGGGNA